MPTDNKDIIDYISHEDINLELLICTRVLKLRSLHFGYWVNGEALTLDNVRRAQGRYTEKLLDRLPEGVRTVLDVGCGIGEVARALVQRGYRVTALSPDRHHATYFEHPDLAGVAFHNVRFEDFYAADTFDAILMSESQNYFDTGDGFRQSRRYLRPGGYLLVCGLFKKNGNRDAFAFLRNVEDDYIAAARRHGLALRTREDITERVLPTMAYAKEQFEEYVEPFFEIAGLYLRGTSPLKRKLVQLFFRKEFERARVIEQYYRDFFDPALLREHVCYATHLYEYVGR